MAHFRRGELWWANLAEPFGSEPGYRRPVVIVQADGFNIGGLQTVVVAIVTSNLGWADFPGNVFLPTDQSGLLKPSVIQATQLMTLDHRRFSEQVSTLPEHIMDQLDDGLRRALRL
jgi:mRNA interferase MazF